MKSLFCFLLFLLLLPVTLFADDAATGVVVQAMAYFPWLSNVLMYAGGFLVLCWLSDVIINDKYDKGWFKKYVLKYLLALPVFKFILQMSFKIPVVGFLLKAIFNFLIKFSPENVEKPS